MNHILVTGAQGFIGQALVRRLLDHGLPGCRPERITLMDLRFDAAHPDPRVRQVAGSIADGEVRLAACADAVDVVFHLASVPGGAAEKDYALGRSVNLDATLGLLEAMREQPRPPRLVYASSVAVYGDQLPERVSEDALPVPALTYGAHKLACEALVADASRRGWVEGCALRLPGVVARPGDGAGLMSAFMSRIFWRLAEGAPVTVPVSPQGTAWWISVGACVDNLCHAASLDPAGLDARRCCQMPVLHLAVGEVVEALVRRFGADRAGLVSYAPDPLVQRLFASLPPMDTPRAEALGFRHDGDVDQLIQRAMA